MAQLKREITVETLEKFLLIRNETHNFQNLEAVFTENHEIYLLKSGICNLLEEIPTAFFITFAGKTQKSKLDVDHVFPVLYTFAIRQRNSRSL